MAGFLIYLVAGIIIPSCFEDFDLKSTPKVRICQILKQLGGSRRSYEKSPSQIRMFQPVIIKNKKSDGLFPQPFANRTTHSRTGQTFLPYLPEDCFPAATRKSLPGVAGSFPGRGWWDRWPCSRHPGRCKRQSSSSRPGECPAP